MAYLEITLKVAAENRVAAAGVYQKYKQPFLDTVSGAESKELLVRDVDVQVLHGFTTVAEARAYLDSTLFKQDVVGGLAPLLAADPEVRIYDTV
ncbi:hypothetical protein ACFV27_39710 [Streptomyces antimycoticus]|uniref:ABM domain-containing protein n=2 Tax=Streptomyces violaceusniger group TaxID=2839105 RepID=A0ABD5J6R8_9ACTN|nr:MULTISPECIES: hypothetical protein [Streptomyces]MEE4582989.1 hypothetical protein [Streptomyces sp. DSM 41602]KUL47230.1 hypothetical protein ADL28_32910 [Streptomyces violaceusniger]QTI88088.1 hypothetical protein AS97_45410 [Streptomyces sp. AgN23]WJE00851.1 hypothetical protein QR300_35605 [Streptomyces antimycoticus]WTB09426.1 hypothetical protein OG546_37790 [Streptomyces antimycoticus]